MHYFYRIFQHFLASFAGILSTPLIIIGLLCIDGNSTYGYVVQAKIVSSMFFAAGVGTVLQTALGPFSKCWFKLGLLLAEISSQVWNGRSRGRGRSVQKWAVLSKTDGHLYQNGRFRTVLELKRTITGPLIFSKKSLAFSTVHFLIWGPSTFVDPQLVVFSIVQYDIWVM